MVVEHDGWCLMKMERMLGDMEWVLVFTDEDGRWSVRFRMWFGFVL